MHSQAKKQHPPGVSYVIVLLSEKCTASICARPCRKQDSGNLCWHMYSCKCVDYKHGYLCKHVHAVHMQYGKSAVMSNGPLPDITPSGKV